MNRVDGVNSVTLAPAPVPVPSEQLTQQRELIQAIKALNKAELFGQNSELTFALDRETRRLVVRIVDRTTNELIRQIPPEYVLRLAEVLRTPGGQGA